MRRFFQPPLRDRSPIMAKQILRHHGQSFHLASCMLPARSRWNASRLYAFCRHVDDLADSESDKPFAAQRLRQLRRALIENKAACRQSDEFLTLAQEVDLPLQAAVTLIDTVSAELTGQVIKTQAELVHYSYGAAGTVGSMMCSVLGCDDEAALPHAIDLGIAMQLTNIARDVGEDAAMNRIYLPACWLSGMSPTDIIAPDPSGEQSLKSATARCLKLADHYYTSGLSGLHYLPVRSRYSILVAAQLYRAIGGQIIENDFRTWDRRATLASSMRLNIAFQTLTRQLLGARPAAAHSSLPGLVVPPRKKLHSTHSPRRVCQASDTSIY